MEEEYSLQVGQIFRVFEVTEKGDLFKDGVKGSWFSECNDYYLGNPYGVNIPCVPSWTALNRHIGIDDREQGKLVAQLRVTKLK